MALGQARLALFHTRLLLTLVFGSVPSPEVCLKKSRSAGTIFMYIDRIFVVGSKKRKNISCAVAAEQVSSTREEEVFEIRIDGKLVCNKRRGKLGVYLPMETFEQVQPCLRTSHPFRLSKPWACCPHTQQ